MNMIHLKRITFHFLAGLLVSTSVFAAGPSFKKVFIIVLENTNASDALKQPYLKSLASGGAYLSQFYAETHPSQPNYIAMATGDTHGVGGDGNVDLDVQSIADLLEAKGKSWKTYQEEYPGNCFTGTSRGNYYRKHNPFISIKNIQSNPARCARIVGEKTLDQDIKAGTLPDYSLYVPGIKNDGHDTDVGYADKWLQKTFGPRLNDRTFMQDMLFIVTFDESGFLGGDHIYTVLVGDSVKAGAKLDQRLEFYNILRTIEDTLALGTLGLGDAKATALSGAWK